MTLRTRSAKSDMALETGAAAGISNAASSAAVKAVGSARRMVAPCSPACA